MKKFLKIAFITIALGAVIIQFIPVPLANPPVVKTIDAPAEVLNILRKGCFDCHSHETICPWYSKVAPVSWLMYRDINEARRKLNFSDWSYPDKKKKKKLGEMIEEIKDGEMPPWFYLIMHSDATLTGKEKATLELWVHSQVGSDSQEIDEHGK